MNEVVVKIDDATLLLLNDVVIRSGRSMSDVLTCALVDCANTEYEKQQIEDAKTC